MRRFALLLLAAPAFAQPIPCEPVDVPVQAGRPYTPRGTRARPTIRTETCAQETLMPPPPRDILHGPPAEHGLLRGEGPKDLLTNRYQESVTIAP